MITAAFVTHSAQPSGAELFVARVCAAAERVSPVVVLGEHGPLEGILADLGVETVVVPVGLDVQRVRAGGLSLVQATHAAAATMRTTLALRRWLRRRRIDVVVTHSAKAHVYAAVAARTAGIPVVAHAHDLLGAGGGRATTALLGAAYRFLPAAVIANSRTTARTLPAAVALRTTVIGCPAVVGSPTPRRTRVRRFAVVGRLAEWKGQLVAIRAFDAARTRGLATDSTLTLVGAALFDGDRGYERELRDEVATLGLDGSVYFTGHVDDVAGAYADADAVLHTSLRPEPFGQVVVEAMAAARPIVAVGAGGPAEIITPDVDGVLVPPGDVDALADVMLRLQEDDDLVTALVSGGARTAPDYGPAVIVDQIERVIAAVARHRRQERGRRVTAAG